MSSHEDPHAHAPEGPLKQGYMLSAKGDVIPVTYVEHEGMAIIEGDMIIATAEQMEQTARVVNEARAKGQEPPDTAILVSPGAAWPECTIPYVANVVLDFHLKAAIAYFNSHMPVGFRPKMNTDTQWITISNASSNSSTVGYHTNTNSRPTMTITIAAEMHTILHEMLHAAGMSHEMTRRDRDSYIKVNYNNISKGKEHNYDIKKDARIIVGVYDYGSIMHYSTYAYSKNLQATIETKDYLLGNYLGKAKVPTVRDLMGASALYLHTDQQPIYDIDIVSKKGANYGIAVKEGYIFLPNDINEGAKGDYIYLRYTKKKKAGSDQKPITDIKIIYKGEQEPAGYTKVDQNLNAGTKGSAIHLYYKRGDGVPVCNLMLISGTEHDFDNMVNGYGFSVIHKDLNKGARGKFIYLAYQRPSSCPIIDIKAVCGSDVTVEPPEGYDRLNISTNLHTNSKKQIYLCLKRAKSGQGITDLKVISSDKPLTQQDAPQGWTMIPQDLSEGAEGKYCYLCMKKDPTKKFLIKNIDLIYGANKDIQPPGDWGGKWYKLDGDLNEGTKPDAMAVDHPCRIQVCYQI